MGKVNRDYQVIGSVGAAHIKLSRNGKRKARAYSRYGLFLYLIHPLIYRIVPIDKTPIDANATIG